MESWDLSPCLLTWEAGGFVFDPKRHALPRQAPSAQPDHSAKEQELLRISDLIRRTVTSADEPVPCGKLATLITNQHGSLVEEWNGKSTFRKFVESLDVSPVIFDWNVSGGCAYGPRHSLAKGVPEQRHALADWERNQALLQTAK